MTKGFFLLYICDTNLGVLSARGIVSYFHFSYFCTQNQASTTEVPKNMYQNEKTHRISGFRVAVVSGVVS